MKSGKILDKKEEIRKFMLIGRKSISVSLYWPITMIISEQQCQIDKCTTFGGITIKAEELVYFSVKQWKFYAIFSSAVVGRLAMLF